PVTRRPVPGLARAVDTGIRRAAVGRAAVGCGVVGGGGRSRQSVAGTPAPTGRRGLTVGHQVSFAKRIPPAYWSSLRSNREPRRACAQGATASSARAIRAAPTTAVASGVTSQ